MKATRIYLLLAVLLYGLPASAQRRLIVVDVETSVPVDGANVVGNSLTAQTDTLGYVTVPDSCHSLLFSHVNYESRLINLKEVRDTVFLISKLLNVKEVVVFGQAPYEEKYKNLQKGMVPSKTELQLAAAQPGYGINLLGLINHVLPKKWKKSPKERRKERLKRTLDDY
jgi:hypothetical protein